MRAPPGGVVTVVAMGAGLTTGLLHFWGPAAVLAMLMAAIALPGWRHLVAIAGLGALLGLAALRLDRATCAAQWSDGQLSVELRLIEPVEPGGLGRAERAGQGCTGTVSVRWPRRAESAPAGTVADIRGRWRRHPRWGKAAGQLSVSSAAIVDTVASPSGRLRNVLAERAATLYGSRAPLVDALVLGRRDELEPGLRENFASAGMAHLLAISGFHVGVLVGWVVLVLRLVGRTRMTGMTVGAGLAICYAGFLGFPAPATRAAVLCAVAAVALRRQRHATPGSVLACTCLIVIMADPWAVTQVGAWLSVTALWGAYLARSRVRALVGPGFLTDTIAASAGATLGTAPITALTFGSVPLGGVAVNILAIPLAAVAVPGVALSLMIGPSGTGVGEALAGGAGLALHLLELLAFAAGRVEALQVRTRGGWGAALPWLAVTALLMWTVGRRNRPIVIAARGAAIAALVSWGVAGKALGRPDGEGRLSLHFLDIGQGDAAAIRTPHGHWILVDAGPADDRYDAGRGVVVPYLRRHRVAQLDALVLSHAHLDHIGGASAVVEEYPPALVLEPGDASDDAAYQRLLGDLTEQGIDWVAARRGVELLVDSVRLAIIHPDTGWAAWGMDLNEDSAVLLLEYRQFRALFAGDAGAVAEAVMRGRVGDISILKVGHHGSATATTEEWLDELRPEAAVISAGQRNRYHHPAPETVARLQRVGASVWRTDMDGNITVTTDGSSVDIAAGPRHVRFPAVPMEMHR